MFFRFFSFFIHGIIGKLNVNLFVRAQSGIIVRVKYRSHPNIYFTEQTALSIRSIGQNPHPFVVINFDQLLNHECEAVYCVCLICLEMCLSFCDCSRSTFNLIQLFIYGLKVTLKLLLVLNSALDHLINLKKLLNLHVEVFLQVYENKVQNNDVKYVYGVLELFFMFYIQNLFI